MAICCPPPSCLRCLRPLRGRQGTFDKIIENVRKVAHKVSITIGGNFDESSWESYPALLDFLRDQEFADTIAKINFKPIIKGASTPKGLIPLTAVGTNGQPLNGTCMTTAGAGKGSSMCDSCHFVDEKMTFLRDETRRRGFPTPDGVHMGPCEIHRKHAHTIGPDGSLYACPGFTGEKALSTGHISGRSDAWRDSNRTRFDTLDPWKDCGDCAYMPICAGGCVTASYSQLGDVNTPTCHKRSFESAIVSLAHELAGATESGV